jgi:hypothetical protein
MTLRDGNDGGDQVVVLLSKQEIICFEAMDFLSGI